MKKVLSLVAILVCCVSGCSTVGLDRNAKLSKSLESKYEIIIKDKRKLRAHDITGLLGHTYYVVESHILTPTIDGVVNASNLEVFEITTIDNKKRKNPIFNISGNISFDRNMLTVNILSSGFIKRDPVRAYKFNGTYNVQNIESN